MFFAGELMLNCGFACDKGICTPLVLVCVICRDVLDHAVDGECAESDEYLFLDS